MFPTLVRFSKYAQRLLLLFVLFLSVVGPLVKDQDQNQGQGQNQGQDQDHRIPQDVQEMQSLHFFGLWEYQLSFQQVEARARGRRATSGRSDRDGDGDNARRPRTQGGSVEDDENGPELDNEDGIDPEIKTGIQRRKPRKGKGEGRGKGRDKGRDTGRGIGVGNDDDADDDLYGDLYEVDNGDDLDAYDENVAMQKLTHLEEPWSTRVSLPQYSLGPPPFAGSSQIDYEPVGDAIIKKGHILLTDASPSMKGGVWSKKQIVTSGQNWQVDIRFRVGGSKNKDYFGDGIAFFYTTERAQLGEALGGPDKFHGLGVFFDTYKNHNFKAKRHPYIYGLVNDGSKLYTEVGRDAPGCHVPFRDTREDLLSTAIARITYLDGSISVVMQPKGAVDWVRCFKMDGTRLPKRGYFGVTAMTGQLVDKHLLQQMHVYGNVDVQPWEYSHHNDAKLMPGMWTEMLHSGKEARMFELFEDDDIEDTLKWRVVKRYEEGQFSDGTNAYDSAYFYYEDDPVEGEGDDIEDLDDDKEYHSPFEDAYYEDDEEIDDVYDPDLENEDENEDENEARVNKDEVKLLYKKIEGTEVARRLHHQHKENAKVLKNVHQHLRRQMQQTTDELHEHARRVRKHEHDMMDRIFRLSDHLNVKVVDPFSEEMENTSSGWLAPFVIVVALLGVLVFLGRDKYQQHMKSHLM